MSNTDCSTIAQKISTSQACCLCWFLNTTFFDTCILNLFQVSFVLCPLWCQICCYKFSDFSFYKKKKKKLSFWVQYSIWQLLSIWKHEQNVFDLPMKTAKYHLQRAKIFILSSLATGFIRTYGLLTALKAVKEEVFEGFLSLGIWWTD